jgi:hypothetical protein
MAKIKNNLLITGISGIIGESIAFRQKAGKTFLVKARRSHQVTMTQKYMAAQARFQASVVYAKRVVKDSAAKSLYASKTVDGQTAFNLALSDAYHSPVVSEIITENYHGGIEDLINIKATDNFKVAKVTLSIFGSDGSLLETGPASDLGNELDWTYIVKASNTVLAGTRIIATAADLPGNTHSIEVILP